MENTEKTAINVNILKSVATITEEWHTEPKKEYLKNKQAN